jgi:hypothetical protein
MLLRHIRLTGAYGVGRAERSLGGNLVGLRQVSPDVGAWAEKSTLPTDNNNYAVADGQIEEPETAVARGGIQPVVKLTANGGVRADIKADDAVKFSGVLDVPHGTGKVVIAAWGFEETGDYPVAGEIKPGSSSSHAKVSATHTFPKPGIYFPVARRFAIRVRQYAAHKGHESRSGVSCGHMKHGVFLKASTN